MKSIDGILLSAGQSTRMATAKLLLPIGQQTLFEIALVHHLQSSLRSLCAVIPRGVEACQEIVAKHQGTSVHLVEVDQSCRMSDSLKAGWRWVQDNWMPDAVMISLADMPLITKTEIDLLIDSYLVSNSDISVPTHKGQWGHPVILSSRFDEEIMRITGDIGAREVLARHHELVREVAVDTDAVLIDIDHPADIDSVKKRLNIHE